MKWNPALVLAAALAAACSAYAQGMAYVDVPVQGRENVSFAYADVLRAIPTYEISRIVEPVVECGEDIAGDAHPAEAGEGGAPDDIVRAEAADASDSGAERNAEAVAQPPCRTVMVEREERRISGYDVEYRYKGELYLSRMDVDPGNKLRIRVTVAPAD